MSIEQQWEPALLTPSTGGVEASASGLLELLVNIDIAALLTEHRALACRGFDVTRADLDPVIDHLLPNRLSYTHGNTPRTNLGGNLYTSTEYPADQSISMHSELSYAHRWPDRLLFFCAVPATTGGATSVADAGAWLRSLDDEVRDAFAGGVCYTQNLHSGRGLGKSWQQTFETEDRETVERFLSDGGSTWTWGPTGLRVSQIRPSTTRHPVTGEEVWFNQVDQWHPAGLPAEIREFMLEMVAEEDLPQFVSFADGTPIPDKYIEHIKDVGWQLAYDMDWRAGDVLLVDNVLAAHARRPYTGERKVLVAMSG